MQFYTEGSTVFNLLFLKKLQYIYSMFINLISLLLKILAIIVPLSSPVAYFTIAERKLMGIIQRRKGPNVIGFRVFYNH